MKTYLAAGLILSLVYLTWQQIPDEQKDYIINQTIKNEQEIEPIHEFKDMLDIGKEYFSINFVFDRLKNFDVKQLASTVYNYNESTKIVTKIVALVIMILILREVKIQYPKVFAKWGKKEKITFKNNYKNFRTMGKSKQRMNN